ncbi:unnamed protein product [Pocillopora meandrina]|uniref:Uncharacterized protein n=1 Tax=Pocillopora meandrina TaxID=46732 RepID=A0AAU9WT74_9CNID|nr:unnamed protein product [Pocillopora meandrina]
MKLSHFVYKRRIFKSYKTSTMLASIFLYLGIGAFISRASDTANVWQKSRILLIADLGSSMIDAEKLQTSFLGADQANLGNEFVILQRARDGGFESHGLFQTLTSVQDRKYISIRKENFLPWLLEKKPNFLICVAVTTEVPQILTVAQNRGLLPLETKLIIRMVKESGKAAGEKNVISMKTPRPKDLNFIGNDGNRLESREITFSSGRKIENIILEAFREEYNCVHNRQRRAAPLNLRKSIASAAPLTSGPVVSLSVTSSAIPAPSSSGPTVSAAVPMSSSSTALVRTVLSSSSPMTSTVPLGSSPVASTLLSMSAPTIMLSSSRPAVSSSHPSPSRVVSAVSSSSSQVVTPASLSASPAVSSAPSSLSPAVSMAPSSPAVTLVSSSSSPAVSVMPSSSTSAVTPVHSSPSSVISTASSSSSPAVFPASLSSSSVVSAVPSSSSPVVSALPSSLSPVVSAMPSSSIPLVSATPSSSSGMIIPASSSSSFSVIPAPSSSSPIDSVASSSSRSIVSPVPSSSSLAVSTAPSSSSPVVGAASSRSRSLALPASSSSSHAFSAGPSSPVVIPSSSRFFTQVQSSSNTVVPSSSRSTVTAALSSTSPVISAALSSSRRTAIASLSSTSSVVSAALSSSRRTATTVLSNTSPFVSTALSSSSSVVSAALSSTSPFVTSLTSGAAGSSTTLSSSLKVSPTSSRPMLAGSPTVSASISAIGPVNTMTNSLVSSTTSNTVASKSIVISSATTARKPTPSSSQVVTEQPLVYENETVVVVFDGDCNYVKSNKDRENDFREAVQMEVSSKLRIPRSAIVMGNITCGSIRVPMTIHQSGGLKNVVQVLKKIVDSGNLSVTLGEKKFKASKLEVVRPTSPVTQAPTTEAKSNKIAFYLYIGFGTLMAVVFFVGICVLIFRCRKDRREGSFFLTNDTHYELRRFHGIPRASSYSRVNYYGEPVEMDATAADPNADDEFKVGAYSFNRSPARGRGKLTGTTNGDAHQQDKFNVGALGMPEWNLPRLSDNQMTVAESKEDIPRSAGSVGSRQLLIDSQESSLADSAQAYDNPVLTFGDGPQELSKEENQS